MRKRLISIILVLVILINANVLNAKSFDVEAYEDVNINMTDEFIFEPSMSIYTGTVRIGQSKTFPFGTLTVNQSRDPEIGSYILEAYFTGPANYNISFAITISSTLPNVMPVTGYAQNINGKFAVRKSIFSNKMFTNLNSKVEFRWGYIA